MNEDFIQRSDAIKHLKQWFHSKGWMVSDEDCKSILWDIPSADRSQGWVDKAISIIDDMQREGFIDYYQAWEFRMRARMKGADDE